MIPFRYRASNVTSYLAAALTLLLSGAVFAPVGDTDDDIRAEDMRRHRGLRVALVSEFAYPTLGGIQDHLYYFSRELIRRGHQPTIITPHVIGAGEFHHWWPTDLPKAMQHEVGYSLPVFINGSLGRTTAGVGIAGHLRALLTPQNFDIVHLHSPLAGILPILAMANASVPVVGTFHTSFATSTLIELMKPLARKQIDALAATIAVSPVSAASIGQYFDLDPTLVPNGIDTTQFRPWWKGVDDRLPEFRDGRVNIFFIGRPDPRNGLDSLIRAFARVHKAAPETRLLIAGDGGLMHRYRTMVAQLLPEGSVEFLGAVRDERPVLYRTADIHVFGVERAAFSVTLLEGMASGLPVITTNWTGHEYMGTAGTHFVTVPFDDDEVLAKELMIYVKDPRKRRDLGERARAHALKYDWSVIAGRILDVYTRTLTAAGRPVPRTAGLTAPSGSHSRSA